MRAGVTLIAALLLASGCAPDGPPLTATDVEITRPLPGSGMSAGYLVLQNTSRDDIVITRITSPDFAAVAMHESVIENGIARMRPLDTLTVPARGEVVLERGGLHLMLHGPADQIRAVTLQFHSGDVPILTIMTDLED